LSRLVPRCPTIDFFWEYAGQQAEPAPNMKKNRGAERGAPVKVGRTQSHPVAPGQTKKKIKKMEAELILAKDAKEAKAG
jgi:hypothetical protein